MCESTDGWLVVWPCAASLFHAVASPFHSFVTTYATACEQAAQEYSRPLRLCSTDVWAQSTVPFNEVNSTCLHAFNAGKVDPVMRRLPFSPLHWF